MKCYHFQEIFMKHLMKYFVKTLDLQKNGKKKHEHLGHDFQKMIKNAQNVPQWVEINIAPAFSRDFLKMSISVTIFKK